MASCQLKSINIALRYDMQGKPIRVSTVRFDEPVAFRPLTEGVTRGHYRGITDVDTIYGKYKVAIDLDLKSGKLATQYSHKSNIPAPIAIELEIVNG